MSLGVHASAATPVGRFRIVGMAHGVPFLGYCATLALAARRLGGRRSVVAFVMAFVPGGTFWLEARLRQDERG